MWNRAKMSDVKELVEMFFNNLEVNPQYISHGEIQMGIANEEGEIAANGRELWESYITEKIVSEGKLPSVVLLLRGEESLVGDGMVDESVAKEEQKILAFGVLEVTEDGHKPFGMICDMLVDSHLRGRGVGTVLFKEALGWFKESGVSDIYLESGINNHRVHKYFEHLGFEVVSHIFKLKRRE